MEAASVSIIAFFLILSGTALIKTLTALAIFRQALNLPGFGFGAVMFVLAIAISFFAVDPLVTKVGGWEVLSDGNQLKLNQIQEVVKPWMQAQADSNLLEKFTNLKQDPARGEFSGILLAFVLTQLQDAFILGLMILLPFIILDLIVVNLLAVLNVTQISAVIVSLPLKLLLLVSLDGFKLITDKLLQGYL